MGGDSKLDFKGNRYILLRYLGASQHWACQEFIQAEKYCVYLLLHSGHELFSNQYLMYGQFHSLSDHQGSLASSKDGVPTTRTSRPFGADRDFMDTIWGAPNAPIHSMTYRTMMEMFLLLMLAPLLLWLLLC